MNRLRAFLGVMLVLVLWNPGVSNPATSPQQPKATLLVTVKESNAKFEVRNWEIGRYEGSGSFYQVGNDFQIDYVPLWFQSALVLKFQLQDVRQIVISRDYDNPVVLTLNDGTEFRGVIADVDKGQDHKALAIHGRIVKLGYPAKLDIDLEKIDKVLFSRDSAGKVIAEVRQVDGTIQSAVQDINFRVKGYDSRSDLTSIKFLELKMADVTLEVPLSDIAILRIEKTTTIELRNGKTLSGEISGGYNINGTVTYLGKQVPFSAEFSGLGNVKSIELRK